MQPWNPCADQAPEAPYMNPRPLGYEPRRHRSTPGIIWRAHRQGDINQLQCSHEQACRDTCQVRHCRGGAAVVFRCCQPWHVPVIGCEPARGRGASHERASEDRVPARAYWKASRSGRWSRRVGVVRAVKSARTHERGLGEDDLLTLIAENTGIPVRLIRVAVRYWASYPDEVNAEIAAAEAADDAAEDAWRRERQLLAG